MKNRKPDMWTYDMRVEGLRGGWSPAAELFDTPADAMFSLESWLGVAGRHFRLVPLYRGEPEPEMKK